MTRRPLTRVGWAAAVAGLLGSHLPASAQPLFQRGYRTVPVANAKAPGPAPDPAALRLVQTRVQLAWLSDPVTFGSDLSLSAGPRGFLVSGFVPNEGVRQRAVQLASQSIGQPVADDLKVHPTLLVRHARPASAEDLRREAVAALKEAFGERAGRWQVSAGADGRVTVAGPRADPEEQLQIARSLRRAAHCACVNCQLTLGEFPWAPAFAGPAPAVGPPAAVPQPAPAKQTAVARHPENATPPAVPAPLPIIVTSAAGAPIPEVKAPVASARPPEVGPERPPVKAEVAGPVVPPPAPPRPIPANLSESPKLAAGAPPAPAGVYETTGEFQWESTPDDGKGIVLSSGANAPAFDAARVREAIRVRCGADVREVRVEFLGDRRLHITLRVAPGADRGQVENRVRQIPDVANYPHGHFLD